MAKTQTRSGGRFADRPGRQGKPAEEVPGRLALAQLPILSAGAGAIHLAVAADHFEYFWLHGTFFLVIGLAQLAWAGLIVAFPFRPLFQAAVAGNGAVIATWIVSRVVGAPFGPNPWTPESIALEDALATSFEVALVLWSLRLAFGFGPRLPEMTSPAQLVPVAGLLVLFIAGGIISASIRGHGHGGTSEAAATGGHHAGSPTSGTPIAPDDPLFLELKEAVGGGGAVAGMDLLERRAAEDPRVKGLSHQYVHSLARYHYEVSPNAATAFTTCDGRFEGGCYHGVLQGYFEDNPGLSRADVAGLCDQLGAGAGTALKWQCLHGLGHGFSLLFDHNLLRPLRYCDFLRAEWDQRSCYGGVFMENVIWSQSSGGGARSTGEGVIREDLHYPCNAVAEKYQTDCWLMQTSTILHLVNWDFAAAFASCDKAEKRYVGLCYESMGRDIAGYTVHDPVRSAELCLQGSDVWRGSCFGGAVKQLVDFYGGTEEALEMCRSSPGETKPLCYHALGQIASFYWNEDPQRIRVECAKAADPRWIAVCTQAAQAA